MSTQKMHPSKILPKPETTQTISFSEGDGVYSSEVFASDVVVTTNAGNHNHGSSKVKLKSIVDYNWEPKFYTGQLLAVHLSGKYLAYSIKAANPVNPGTWNGMIRVIYSSETGSDQRSLIKGIQGEVHDLSFAHIDSEVILACIDEQGNFYIHKIEMLDGALIWTLLAEIKEDTGAGGSAHRVVWCPFIPDEDDTPDDYHALLLVTTHDNIARIWSIRSVIQNLRECSTDGGVRACAGALLGREGVLTSEEHTAPLVDAAFSPDGTALATASSDGYVMFFQVYIENEKTPRCLHKWQPHDGLPLSCLFFLDNHKNINSEVQFWKFAVTGAQTNTVLKIWSCKSWNCLQTINFTPDLGSEINSLGLKAVLDSSANYLVLSDFRARSLYVLHMTRNNDDTIAYCKSISEFLLPYPVLSFCIVDVDEQIVKCESSCSDPYHRNSSSGDIGISPTDYDLHHDIDGVGDGCMNGSAEGTRRVRLRLYIVQPKGVQEGQLVFTPPESSNDVLGGLEEITLGEEAKEPVDSAEDHNQYSILQKQSQELKNLLMRSQPLSGSILNQRAESPLSMPISLNLMTPDAFSSPGKHDDEDPPLALTPDIGKRPSGHSITTGSKESEHLTFGLDAVEPPNDVKFTSGGSSPSREVQKIMALDPIYYKEQTDEQEAIEDSVFSADVYASSEKSTSLIQNNSETTWPQISMAQINEANQRKASSDKSSSHSLNLSAIETVPVVKQEEHNQTEDKEMTMNLSHSDRNRLDGLEEKIMQLTEAVSRIERNLTTHDNGGSARDLIDRALAAHTERTVLAIENALSDGSTRFWDRIARAGEAAGARAAQTAGVNAARALEPLAKALQHELATKLTTTDSLLRENIEKLVNSKTVLDNLSNKVGNVVAVTARDSFRETVTQTLLPSVETVHAQMFKQINQAFNNGVKEFTACTEVVARTAAERGAAAAVSQVTTAMERHAEALTAAATAAAAAIPNTENYSKAVHDATKSVLEKEMSWFREQTRNTFMGLSRAHSPATPASVHSVVMDRQMQAAQIQAMINAGDINGAFQLALSASDLALVMTACRAANPDAVFGPPTRLKQHVLLSLIQQLAADMTQDANLKQKYLEEALMNLDTSNPVTREHLPIVMRELHKQLMAFVSANPNHILNKKFKVLLIITNSLIKGNV